MTRKENKENIKIKRVGLAGNWTRDLLDVRHAGTLTRNHTTRPPGRISRNGRYTFWAWRGCVTDLEVFVYLDEWRWRRKTAGGCMYLNPNKFAKIFVEKKRLYTRVYRDYQPYWLTRERVSIHALCLAQAIQVKWDLSTRQFFGLYSHTYILT